MTHLAGPCELFHDPLDDVSYLPDLTPLQAAVVELLELNPEHRARPRLSCHEMRRVDAVLAWADARTAAALSIPAPRLPV